MAEPTPTFRCETCRCHSYARVAEKKPDNSFGPGPLVRCVECKSVVAWPPVGTAEAKTPSCE